MMKEYSTQYLWGGRVREKHRKRKMREKERSKDMEKKVDGISNSISCPSNKVVRLGSGGFVKNTQSSHIQPHIVWLDLEPMY